MYDQMMPLQGFYNAAVNQPHQPNKTTDVSFSGMYRFAFKKAVNNISLDDEHNLAVFIKNNIDEIVDDILKNNVPYSNLFRDTRFVSAFTRAISSIPIEYKCKLACNKITYDYFTCENPVPDIKKQFLNISKVINRAEINKLITIGLDENTACNLALCRYSSDNERTNVKRLNFAIYYRDPEVMTEQMIVWIYEKMFNRISDLFYATMFEVYSPQEQDAFGESFMEIYGTVSLAVLTILNNMTSENIRKVLLGYNEEWEFKNRHPVRFSLHNLSEDFSRISRTVEYLDSIAKVIP